MKPRIVLSGVNFVEGGPLAVFQDALAVLSADFLHRFEVIALVHRSDLFQVPGIQYREFPEVKGSWFARLTFEYRRCLELSRELSPTLWLAMHDITPNVSAHVRAVYCHNPAPFYRLGLREAFLDPTFALFRVFYKYLYAINIEDNDFVVVQQDWLREEFRSRYRTREVVVAHPSIPSFPIDSSSREKRTEGRYIFFYPAFPRSFKNFELALEAARMLEKQTQAFEVWITIDGSENRYAAKLRQEFASLRSVRWLGKQPRNEVEAIYSQADCLLFPSKLETWGMPISEWKRTGKPMLVADLPYAHETVGTYSGVAFVDAKEPESLVQCMSALLSGRKLSASAQEQVIQPPFARDWRELFDILLSKAVELSPGVSAAPQATGERGY